MRFSARLAIACALAHASGAGAAGGVVGTGNPASCTPAAFDTVFFNAQSSGGGVITFNCGTAPHAIILSSYKPVSTNTEVRGGDLITLSGGNSSGVFQVFAAGTLKLGNLTIARALGQYGAIENFGVLTVANSRFETNASSQSGGAITNRGSATLTGVIFVGDTAVDNGGGIATEGGALVVIGSEFTANIAGKQGGGIDIAAGATASVETSRFTGNKATEGGAIRNAGTLTAADTVFWRNIALTLGGGVQTASGAATMSRTLFWENLSAGGGAIHQTSGVLTLTQSNLATNGWDRQTEETLAASGGAIRREGGTAVLADVTLVANRAENGGGIANLGGTATLTNVTLSINRAALSGGAIDMTGGTVTITNATILDNSGTGLARRGGTLTVKNTALSNPGYANCLPVLIGATFSLSSDSTCGFGAARDNVAMEFEQIAFNGGFTLTNMPLPGNPVVDQGTGTGCPSTDQRGVARPSGLACDVGAVESVAGAPSVALVVEYFHAGFGHYFVSLGIEEIFKLDAGVLVGWQRTGQHFNVYRNAAANLAAVCRFFTVAFAPKSSHFYAPREFGCEGTLQNADWQFEGDVFYTPLPGGNGACPTAHLPIYRLYNSGQGGAPNHRFTTDPAIRTQMIARGFMPEGAGVGVGMCSPQ